jgi:hypothetical protein
VKASQKKMILILIGAVLGGIVGFLFYRFVGCHTGACKIAGNPYLSTVYWAFLGALIANLFR